jgi:UDP-N-acetylmuramoyl-L-alanyl-D-glutamate--2,6-diaminopimelate ligase
MKLSYLIEGLETKYISGPIAGDVLGIAYHSHQVQPNFLFVAMKGSSQNGHEFISESISRGAKAVIAENIPLNATGVTLIQVPDSRKALAQVSAIFLANPSLHLKVVGITGTNGKTTTSYLLESIFSQAGYIPGVIGTINYRFGNKIVQSSNTTPESLEIQKLLARMVEEKVSHVVIEVSSHALDQNRVEGVHFDVGVFTNLTSEHLDYHGTIERYAQSKAKLFSLFLEESNVSGLKFAVLNQDDPQAQYLQSLTTAQIIRYGMGKGMDITIEDAMVSTDGVSGLLKTPQGDIHFQTPLLGRFNLHNIMAAAGAAFALDIPLEYIRSGLKNVTSVPGRTERVGKGIDFIVLVDYAHTPDALEQVLASLKELSPNRIITVFGCGGDRDSSKRPIMGKTAAFLSDVVIITSDNPRTEKPEQIISEIEEGVKESGIQKISSPSSDQYKGYLTVVDRTVAIQIALRMAQRGDIVLVAGKGHEDYQILGKRKIAFDDRKKIEEVLQKDSFS